MQRVSPKNVTIVTKDGELQISLTLDININLNNGEFFTEKSLIKKEENKKEIIEELSVEEKYIIPDFSSSPKINFGEKL